MEADEKTREKIVSTGRTVMAFAIAGAAASPVLAGMWSFATRPEAKGEHFVLWLVVGWLVGVSLCVLAWFVGRGLTRSAEWARKVALWACIALACCWVGGWIAMGVRRWLRHPELAVVFGVVTVIPVAIFAYLLYAPIRWLRSPAVLSVFDQAMTATEAAPELAEVLDEDE